MKPRINQPKLLQCDSRQSVLAIGDGELRAYGCFGWSAAGSAAQMAFNGVLREVGGGYLLGNGYRLYSTALRRFCSPDSWSPFGEGGINAYVYCRADPLNFHDSKGHAPVGFEEISKWVARALKVKTPVIYRRHSLGSVLAPVKSADAPAKSRAILAVESGEEWRGLRTAVLQYDSTPPLSPMTNSVAIKREELFLDSVRKLGTDFGGYDLSSGIDLRLKDNPVARPVFQHVVDNDEFAIRVLAQELLPRRTALVRRGSAPGRIWLGKQR